MTPVAHGQSDSTSARKSILLCDDDVHILRAAEIKFSRAGYDVRAATDGLEAWHEIERRCPDLVITDCQMPNMTGLELVDRVRGTPAVSHLPVIMLTAKGFELSHEDLAERSDRDPELTVWGYESKDNHKGAVGCVLFLDGSVRFVKSEEYDRLLGPLGVNP